MQSLTTRSRRSEQHADTLTKHAQTSSGSNRTATGRRFRLGAQCDGSKRSRPHQKL